MLEKVYQTVPFLILYWLIFLALFILSWTGFVCNWCSPFCYFSLFISAELKWSHFHIVVGTVGVAAVMVLVDGLLTLSVNFFYFQVTMLPLHTSFLCIHIHVCMHVFMYCSHVCPWMSAYINVSIHIYAICTHMYVIYACMCKCIRLCWVSVLNDDTAVTWLHSLLFMHEWYEMCSAYIV